MLDLDWEVGVFRALLGFARWVAPPAGPSSAAGTLAGWEGRLGTVASLVAGEALRVLPARTEGGVRGRDLLVPAVVDLAGDPDLNRGILVLRVVHAATMRRLRLDRTPPPPGLAGEREVLRRVRVAARAAGEDLPRFAEAWADAARVVLHARPPLDGWTGRARAREEAIRALLGGEEPAEGFWADAERLGAGSGPRLPVALWGPPLPVDGGLEGPGEDDGDTRARPPGGTEAAAPPVDLVRRVKLDPRKVAEQVLQHTFEKVETLEAFNGVIRQTDGSDELADHLDALEEVELGALVRGGDDAHGVLRADLGEADVPDVAHVGADEQGIPYPEWDVRAGRYRPDWCTVYPTAIPRRRPGWARAAQVRQRATIHRLRAAVEAERDRLAAQKRQLDGPDVDLDAVVDAHAERHAGHDEARLYVQARRLRRDRAVCVLLDLSLSADAWVDDRRVLDVSREAVLVLGEVAEALGDPLLVFAFASSTRNRCRVWTVKEAGEPWSLARDRLGALEPQGYTRIGAALRHATARLVATPARRRLLLLVSDGKATDYDRYEGRHGVADVRMAIREAEAKGVRPFALAVDRAARDALPSMFGPGAWGLLPRADDLPETLGRVYARWGLRG